MSAFLGSTPTNNIQCPVIIKFSNSGKNVEVVSMNVEPEKCNNNTLERLPFNTKEIMDGTEYLTFVTFDPNELFVSGVDFAMQSGAKCDHDLQNILNTSISTVVSSAAAHSVSAPVIVGVSSVSAPVIVGVGSVPASTVVGVSASVSAPVIVGVSGVPTPVAREFIPKNGDWIKFYDFYYKIGSFTRTNNKYNINCEYSYFNGDPTKIQNPTPNPNIDCAPSEGFPHGKCSVITDPIKIKELDDLPIETK
jgi:hypothetical protein